METERLYSTAKIAKAVGTTTMMINTWRGRSPDLKSLPLLNNGKLIRNHFWTKQGAAKFFILKHLLDFGFTFPLAITFAVKVTENTYRDPLWDGMEILNNAKFKFTFDAKKAKEIFFKRLDKNEKKENS